MEPNKHFLKDTFVKDWIRYIYANTFISIFFIILGLALLSVSTSHLYGIMIGLVANWVSIGLFIFISHWFRKVTSEPSGKMWITFLTFVILRAVIFLVIFLVPLFVVNLGIDSDSGIETILEPINIILIILSYQTLTYSLLLGSFFK